MTASVRVGSAERHGGGPTPPPHPLPDRWRILAVLCTSVVMIVVAVSSMNVALPSIQASLGASGRDLQWVVDAYALVFAGLLLPAGALGDRFGRRGALQVGLLVFGLSALVASSADEIGTLIAARGAMGAGAAFIMPATLSIIMGIFPLAERPKAIAVWAVFAGVGGALGPIISGLLLEHLWWGSVLLLDVPLVALLLALSLRMVPASKSASGHPLDVVAAVLSFAALTSLVYAVIEAPERGWTAPSTIATFVLAALLTGAFVGHELRTATPMLDPRLFRRRELTAGSVSITAIFFAIFGMFFLVTQHLQFVRGLSPLAAGLLITPNALAMLLVSTRVPGLTARFGTRRVMTAGFGAASAGFALLATLEQGSNDLTVMLALLCTGTGMALVMPGSTQHIMASVPTEQAGVGSAVNDVAREVGGALGIAISGSIASTIFRSSGAATHIASEIGNGEPARSIGETLHTLHGAALPSALHDDLLAQARNAFAAGASTAFTVMALTTIAAAVVATRLLTPRPLPPQSRPKPPDHSGVPPKEHDMHTSTETEARKGLTAPRPLSDSTAPIDHRGPARHDDFDDIPEFLYGFRAMHLAMRRDAERLVRLAPELDDRRAALRLTRWYERFVVSIEHHHQREDDVIWPLLIGRDPTFSSESQALQHDHRELDRALHAVDVAVRAVADGRSEGPDDLVRDAAALRDHLGTHLDREEAAVFPRITRLFTAEEYAVIEAELRQGLDLSGLAFEAPWVMDGLAPDHIAALMNTVPAPLRVLNAVVFRPRYRRLSSVLIGASR